MTKQIKEAPSCACCNHDHDHDHKTKTAKYIFIACGIILFIASSLFAPNEKLKIALFFVAYILVAKDILLLSAKNISKGEIFDENFLMTIAATGAFIIGEYPEALAVMLLYQVGMFFEEFAVGKSRKSIADLMNIKPDYANLKNISGGSDKVDPQTVKVGDLILVKPGEKIPLDGIVIDGKSVIDTSALSGESIPYNVQAGSPVLSGSINSSGLLTIKVEKVFGESTVSKILNLVESASLSKSKTENFITKFARYYTPSVVFLAVAIAFVPPLFFGENFADWINRGLVFLVISCPCALVISVPLSFFGGIANASRKGILIKGGNYLERLNSADTFIFDKTGTLTKGEFQVSQILPANITKEKLLEIAAFAEIHSSHPIAVSIQKSFGKDIDKNKIKNYTEIAGLGISAIIDEKTVLCGNKKLLEKFNISFKEIDAIGSIVYIAIDNVYAGAIIVSDEIKPDSKKTISELKKLNANIIMLTGDKESAAKETAAQLGINNFFASLLPDEKLLIVDQMEKDKKPSSTIVFVGDGVNDAPVLSRVDIAIAMGGLGSDAAREAADIVLMTDEPLKIIEGLKIARSTHAIVWQNIIFALGIKGLVLIAGAFGFASIWAAVFADVGVTFIAVLNSIRALGK